MLGFDDEVVGPTMRTESLPEDRHTKRDEIVVLENRVVFYSCILR